MSPNSALFLLNFLLFLSLNRVGTANAEQPDCKKACKKHRPPGTSGSYVLDCGTLSDDDENHDHSEQFNCGHCIQCPKTICQEHSGPTWEVKLNCPNSAEDDVEDLTTKRPKKDDEGLTNRQLIGIIAGSLLGGLLILLCVYYICVYIVYLRRFNRPRETPAALTEPPPPMTGYPGAGYGSSFPPSYSGASTTSTSTVQQEKTTGQSAVSP